MFRKSLRAASFSLEANFLVLPEVSGRMIGCARTSDAALFIAKGIQFSDKAISCRTGKSELNTNSLVPVVITGFSILMDGFLHDGDR